MAKSIEVFTGRWCGPSVLCRKGLRKAPFEFSSYDIEQDAVKAMERGIRAVPAILIIDSDNKVAKELIGFSETTISTINKELNKL